jgi:hypothetical protein
MAPNSGNRASRRVLTNIPVGYAQAGRARGTGQIVQLSAGGCILSGAKLDPGGPEVFLHFRIGAEKREVHLRGRVVHADSVDGNGLEFIAVSPDGREMLRQFVEEKVAESVPGPSHPQ